MFLCFRYSTHKTCSEEKKYACHAYLHNSSSIIHERRYLTLKLLIRHLQERSNMLAKNSSPKPQFRNWWKEILGVDDEIATRIPIIVIHAHQAQARHTLSKSCSWPILPQHTQMNLAYSVTRERQREALHNGCGSDHTDTAIRRKRQQMRCVQQEATSIINT